MANWVDYAMIVIALLVAPHLRVVLEWTLAGGLFRMMQEQFYPTMTPTQANANDPATIRYYRSFPNPRDRLRQNGLDISPYTEKLMVQADERIAFLETLPWSFPAENVQISRGPVTIKWDTHLDDFWNDDMDPRHILDSNTPQRRFLDEMTPQVYRDAEEQFEQTLQTVKSLNWQKFATRMGICYGQVGGTGGGTVCAVNRWDAIDVESQDLVGRVQCWSDPGLRHWQPDFLALHHPEFKRAMGTGTVCLVEVQHSVLVVGCPMSHSLVYGNLFEFQHSHGENDWELEIDTTTTPAHVVAEMSRFALRTMCDFGGCHENEHDHSEL